MTTAAPAIQPSAWADAVLAAAILALDPEGIGGCVVRAPAGPVRDAWLALACSLLPAGSPTRRLPLNTTVDRMLGGLDLSATLASGRRVLEKGVLASANGGFLIVPMAERWSAAAAAHIASTLDRRQVTVERDGLQERTPARFAVIAFDEGMPDENRPPHTLVERLALHIDLRSCSQADIANCRAVDGSIDRHGPVDAPTADTPIIKALCATSLAFGIESLRPPLFALTVARLNAKLCGRSTVTEADAVIAARLVLAPRATTVPANPGSPDDQSEAQEAQKEQAGDQSESADDDTVDVTSLTDRLVSAASATLPANLLRTDGAKSVSRTASDGKVGAERRTLLRGRVTGVQPASRACKARLNVLATLRAAAPWQRIRRAEEGSTRNNFQSSPRVRIRRDDFRVNSYKHQSGSTIIFAVDASGSSALHRLSEAKGAVELLLAECYARRDNVALVSFRGATSEVLLAPSRSLARAKRCLAELPGGGGTPLAAGIETAMSIAESARRKGDAPLIVLMTDGRANVARSGQGGRAGAEAEAIAAARDVRFARIAALLIDTSPRPHPFAAVVADELGARYFPLPHADAAAISNVIERERVGLQGR